MHLKERSNSKSKSTILNYVTGMFSRSDKKLIRSLKLKKYRLQHQCYLIEGTKIVKEALLSNVSVLQIFATEVWFKENIHSNNQHPQLKIVEQADIDSVTMLRSSPEVIAIARLPESVKPELGSCKSWILALEDVQDPGNLGALLRVADWFGVSRVICSNSCADAFQPKVVQASKGSVFRMIPYYCNLITLLEEYQSLPVIATAMQGESLRHTSLPENGILLLGNEGHGLSNDARSFADQVLSIPGKGKAESLNIAVAAGVFLDHLTNR